MTDALKLGNLVVSTSAQTMFSLSKMEKQKSLTQLSVEVVLVYFTVPLVHHYVQRKQYSFHLVPLQATAQHQEERAVKICFEKQCVKSAEKCIGQIVLETFALTVRSSEIANCLRRSLQNVFLSNRFLIFFLNIIGKGYTDWMPNALRL